MHSMTLIETIYIYSKEQEIKSSSKWIPYSWIALAVDPYKQEHWSKEKGETLILHEKTNLLCNSLFL